MCIFCLPQPPIPEASDSGLWERAFQRVCTCPVSLFIPSLCAAFTVSHFCFYFFVCLFIGFCSCSVCLYNLNTGDPPALVAAPPNLPLLYPKQGVPPCRATAPHTPEKCHKVAVSGVLEPTAWRSPCSTAQQPAKLDFKGYCPYRAQQCPFPDCSRGSGSHALAYKSLLTEFQPQSASIP